jgi:hypothetical protein
VRQGRRLPGRRIAAIGAANKERTIDIETPFAKDWALRLSALVPLFGHRNWVVVADAAYPAQSNPGIETMVTGSDHIEVLRRVIEAIGTCGHIRANAYVDRELEFVSEDDAPGVNAYREALGEVFRETSLSRLAHERIIRKLDESAHLFSILILKTKMMIPYTSVFMELDCGYWDAAAEQRLRAAIDGVDS